MLPTDTIAAPATAQSAGAIAVIRISGKQALPILSEIFVKKKPYSIEKLKSHTLHLGEVYDEDMLIDQVVAGIFRAPHSYTGGDVVELSCHGSLYIVNRLMQLLQKKGIRTAQPGEFTLRAYLNKKLDLAQAEAVADLIAAESEAAHQTALQHIRGGYSQTIQDLRKQLIHLSVMLELELDFSEEDVEFASRKEIENLLQQIIRELSTLKQSFHVGQFFKNGVPVVIAGKPNAGKSTLLNALLNEERAIVSDIAGTTRDTIEEQVEIGGILFRFIDTAGLRIADNAIEEMGIEKTHHALAKAALILYVFDASSYTAESLKDELESLLASLPPAGVRIIPVANKCDKATDQTTKTLPADGVILSALHKQHIDTLKEKMLEITNLQKVSESHASIVTNARHADAVDAALNACLQAEEALKNGVSNDLLAQDLKTALRCIGQITSDVDVDKDILGLIFSAFCIGK